MVEHQNAPQSSERAATENRKTIAEGAPAGPLDRAASRRRLLRAGAIGAPVIASLLSRPASATGGHTGNRHPRCTTSGYQYMSSASGMIGMSPNDIGETETCELDSPYSWKSNTRYSSHFQSDNYSTNIPKSAKIGSYFSNVPTLYTSSNSYEPNDDYSLYKWLKSSSNTSAKEVIAIFLAKQAGADCAIGVAEIDMMFTAVVYNQDVTISGDAWTVAEVQTFVHQFFS